MVETQQGISTFLSFGTKSVKPEILEELLIGRRDDVDFLTKCVGEIANDGINHQLIIVGQRGMGKTHLLRVLYQRSQVFLQEKKLVIAYFSEEEYGISGYLDFLIRILNAFIRWNDNDRDALNLQMDALRETHANRQVDVAESIITEYIGKQPLLILAENFDTILEALGKDGQGKLRSFLYRHNRTSIIATAQALAPDLGREDRPFYNFFTSIYLKKLNYEDSLALLRALAALEKQENVIQHLNGKGVAQVRAVHDLVKGNHRLLVTFYEFLKADTLATLSKIFIKTLNDLKPYYETFIRYLPPQQQKILYYIALSKMPQNGTEIAKNCFIDQKSLSKQLSELSRRNLIDAITDPADKRNKLYDLAEPLLRISIEIGEHKEGIFALFIDFLANWYSFDELENQKGKFDQLYFGESNLKLKQEYYFDLIAREKAILIKKEIEDEKDTILSTLYESVSTESDYTKLLLKIDAIPGKFRDDTFYLIAGIIHLTHKDYKRATDSLKNIVNYDNIINKISSGVLIIILIVVLIGLFFVISKKKKINLLLEQFEIFLQVGVLINSNSSENEEKESFLELIDFGIHWYLANDKTWTIERILHFEDIISDGYGLPDDLKIAFINLQTFRRYVLEKDERALLELPKEQRAFFVREILEKRNSISRTS